VPTSEQIAVLKEHLDAMRYTVFECATGRVPNPVDPRKEDQVLQGGHRDFDASSKGWTTWDRLSMAERREMLHARVDWHGFDDQQKHRIIERVLRYGNPDSWFDGIAPSLWTQGAKLAEFLKEQARIAGERYKGGA
jgi:hypothetical protein